MNSMSMNCKHQNIRCLNPYEYFRKYECADCGGVFICECERVLALTFLPHQVSFGTEYGTQKSFNVTGFAPFICLECRGGEEEAHPRAAIYGQKGKVERYYWREIFKTYCELSLNWLTRNSTQVKDILEFEAQFPKISKELKKKAKKHWQLIHRENPKYNTKERTESQFLSRAQVPVRKIEIPYRQIQKDGQKIGKWVNKAGELTNVESVAIEWYQSQGYNVLSCERRFISAWIATLLSDIIQDTNDPRIRQSVRHSTRNWTSRNRKTPLLVFSLPEDFGTQKFFERRQEALGAGFDRLRHTNNLASLFDSLFDEGFLLRDYLWANDDDTVTEARIALSIIPKEIVISCIEWAMQDFWHRQPGWPDLFAYRDENYLFSEVKSPHDKLSLEQMNWFGWAIEKAGIPCEICRVEKKE